MATDDITLRHLSRLRVRGAPSTKPGTAGFVPEYTATELFRQTQRSLALKLDGAVTIDALRVAFERLAAAAIGQNLKITGEPLYAVIGDPTVVAPNKREHEACLPV